MGFLLVLVAACGEMLVDPSLAPTSLRLSIAPAEGEIAADGLTDAFDKADRVRVRILRELGPPVTVTRDFTPGDVNTVSVTVTLEADEEPAVIIVELLRGDTVLFRGETEILLVAGGSPTVQLGLEATPDHLEIAGPRELLLSVEGTLRLTASVLFATGDTVSGAPIAWESSDSRVASVTAAGLVTAHSEGITRIRATHGALTDEVEVSVERRVAFVVVEPGQRSLQIGDTIQLTATAYDTREGEITGRAVVWAASGGAVEVNASGRVVAVQAGSAVVSATIEGVSGSAYLSVEPEIPPIGPFHGDWYGLAYEMSPACEYYEACNALHLQINQDGQSPISGILEAFGISFDNARFYDVTNISATGSGLQFGVSWFYTGEGGMVSTTNDFTLTLNSNGTLTGQMLECEYSPPSPTYCFSPLQVYLDRNPSSMPESFEQGF